MFDCVWGGVKVVGIFLEMKDKSKIKVALAGVAIHSQIVSVHEESRVLSSHKAMTLPF